MRAFSKIVFVALLMVVLASLTGCAGSRSVMMTEEGYAPTHIAVGDIIAYTQGQGMLKQDDLERLIVQYLEDAMYADDIRFVRKRDLDEPGVTPDHLALLNVEVTFLPTMSGMENSYDLRYTFTLNRASDGAQFAEGSAKSTDAAVSSGGTMDLESAIQYAANATVKKVKVRLSEK